MLLPLVVEFTSLNSQAFEIQSAIKVYFSSRIKSLLPNPSSYRFDDYAVLYEKSGGYGSAYIKYAEQNSFGITQIWSEVHYIQ